MWTPAAAGSPIASAFPAEPGHARAELSQRVEPALGTARQRAVSAPGLRFDALTSSLTTWNPLAFVDEATSAHAAGRGGITHRTPGRAPVHWPPLSNPFGLLGGGDGGGFLLLFASLVGALLWAAPRLGRWLRPTPDLVQLRYVSPIDVPG